MLTPYQLKEVNEFAKKGFTSFIVSEEYISPYTTITNRTPVKVSSIKGVMGVERIPFTGINLLETEFGPNGESVYELNTKDSRIRLSGNYSASFTTHGLIVQSKGLQFIEIIFYGTGINLLVIGSEDFTTRGMSYSIDGDSSVVMTNPTGTSAMNGRNYAANRVENVVSGLSCQWHTIKIWNTTGVGPNFHGIEIINEIAQIKFTAGTAFSGSTKEVLSLSSNSSYNEGVTGTKGARVIKYIKHGVISQAITEVDSVAKYLDNTNHTNEDIIRRIDWTEFGVNRSDDFSTLTTTSNRAFTSDDGSTTLIAESCTPTEQGIATASLNAYFTIEFIGTGLDLIFYRSTGTTTCQYEVTIDGVIVDATHVWTYQADTEQNLKICSGLPYGAHTVKIKRVDSSSSNIAVRYIILYQPKKHLIPEGAIEIVNYNVIANYNGTTITGTTVDDNTQRPIGVIAKASSVRETATTGTWSISLTPSRATGQVLETTSLTSSATFGFLGTGIVIHNETFSSTYDFTVHIDGTLNNSGVARSNASNLGGGSYRSTSLTTLQPCRIEFTDLTLGFHTIKITFTSGTRLKHNCFYIITPIHINDSSLRVGSLSLKSNNAILPISIDKEEKDKQYHLVVTGVNWTTIRAVGVPYETADGVWRLRFNLSGTVTSATRTTYQVNIAGIDLATGQQDNVQAVIGRSTAALIYSDAIAPNLIRIGHDSGTTNRYWWSGDIELKSKPTWVV